jgi:DNA replication protein DnaC
MLNTPIVEKLEQLRLSGMARALREQQAVSDIQSLSFEERFDLLLDREATERADRQLQRRLKQAGLRQQASMHQIDFRRSRGLDKRLMLELAGCAWVQRHQNVILVGPTGAGKSFLGCALAHAACLNGYTAWYHRLQRLLGELQIARADGRYAWLLSRIARTDVLLIDDWGLQRLTAAQQLDLLELLDDRHQHRSTIVTSQIPVDTWHQTMGDPTLADAILDRLIHNAHHIRLSGESMRRQTSDLACQEEIAN